MISSLRTAAGGSGAIDTEAAKKAKDLRSERKDLTKKMKKIRNDLRNEVRRKGRLMKKLAGLRTEDIVTGLLQRESRNIAREEKASKKCKSSKDKKDEEKEEKKDDEKKAEKEKADTQEKVDDIIIPEPTEVGDEEPGKIHDEDEDMPHHDE